MLHTLISQLLESNQEISRRLHNLEASQDSQSILTNCFRNGNTHEGVDVTEEITEADPNKRDSRTSSPFSNNFQATAFHYSFEIDLNTSRVYRRTEPYESDVSFTSSNVRTHAWSIFSGMSLSEISVVSALALPLYAYDIPNNEWYNFGEIGLAVPMSETRYQETMNWPLPSNTRSTKSTALSAISAPLENITAELQLSTASTSAGLRVPAGAKSSGHGPMLSTPLPDYKHAANQTTKLGAAQKAAKAQRKSSLSMPRPLRVPTRQATTGRNDRMVFYKLVVLGDMDVGKTSLTIQVSFTALSGYMTTEFGFSSPSSISLKPMTLHLSLSTESRQ
jgi:hypothetical protein